MAIQWPSAAEYTLPFPLVASCSCCFKTLPAKDSSPVLFGNTVIRLIESLPDADNPESDPFMTAQAIIVLRESGVDATDERIQRAIDWLKREQRASGRWWMHSLYRGNYHFSTYIATSKAMVALALCQVIEKK